jgi:hypothetical protein
MEEDYWVKKRLEMQDILGSKVKVVSCVPMCYKCKKDDIELLEHHFKDGSWSLYCKISKKRAGK